MPVNRTKDDGQSRRVSVTSKLAQFLAEDRLHRERLRHQIEQTISLDSLLFADYEGKPIDPGLPTHECTRTAKRSGVQGVGLDDLRRTFASLMILQGARPNFVSEALGHPSVPFTVDTYSHIVEVVQSDAMALPGEVLPIGRKMASLEKIAPNLRQFFCRNLRLVDCPAQGTYPLLDI